MRHGLRLIETEVLDDRDEGPRGVAHSSPQVPGAEAGAIPSVLRHPAGHLDEEGGCRPEAIAAHHGTMLARRAATLKEWMTSR